MKVVPIRSKDRFGYPLFSLTIGKAYEVLAIEADFYRILDDPGTFPRGNEPFLFDPACFRIVDAKEPAFWICRIDEDGEQYCYPPEWTAPGFFEDYHDGVEAVRAQFWRDLERYYPETFRERGQQE